MAEVFVSNLESQKAEVESHMNNAGNNLKHLLGIEEDIEIEPTDTLSFTDM
jgi:outer membrane protein TolC